jgi:hypothetical protein
MSFGYYIGFYAAAGVRGTQLWNRYHREITRFEAPAAPRVESAWLGSVEETPIVIYPYRPDKPPPATANVPPHGYPEFRFLVGVEDRLEPASDWLPGPAPWAATIDWSRFTVPGYSTVLWGEARWPAGVDGPPICVLGEPVALDGQGDVNRPQWLWSVVTKYEINGSPLIETTDRPVPVWWPGGLLAHVHRPLLPRVTVPIDTTQPDTLEVDRMAWSWHHGMPLYAAADSHDRLGIWVRQHYYDADLETQKTLMTDGCRQHCVIHHQWPSSPGAWHNGWFWFLETRGRFGYTDVEQGLSRTLVGWRTKSNSPHLYWDEWHNTRVEVMSPSEQQEHDKAMSRLELCGRWIDCKPGLGEPWGTWVGPASVLLAEAAEDQEIGLITDTLHHRILIVGPWRQSDFLDYDDETVADTPVRTWCGDPWGAEGNEDGDGAEARFREPWDILRHSNGKFYATVTVSGRLVEIIPNRLAGTGIVRTVFQSRTEAGEPFEPTDKELRIGGADTDREALGQRGKVSKLPPEVLRAMVRPGPFSNASVLRPQALTELSDGRLMASGFHVWDAYSFDLVGEQVAKAFDLDFSPDPDEEVGTRVFSGCSFVADRRAKVGPIDSIATGAWQSNTGRWWRPSGDTWVNSGPIIRTRPNIGTKRMLDGPANRLPDPAYPLAVSINHQDVGPQGFIFHAANVPWMVYVRSRNETDRRWTDTEFEAIERGQWIYGNGTSPGEPVYHRPSFLKLYGPDFQNYIGPAAMDLWMRHALDERGLEIDRAALAEEIRAGWGTGVPRPELSDEDIDDLILFLDSRTNAYKYGPPIGSVVEPPEVAEVTGEITVTLVPDARHAGEVHTGWAWYVNDERRAITTAPTWTVQLAVGTWRIEVSAIGESDVGESVRTPVGLVTCSPPGQRGGRRIFGRWASGVLRDDRGRVARGRRGC